MMGDDDSYSGTIWVFCSFALHIPFVITGTDSNLYFNREY